MVCEKSTDTLQTRCKRPNSLSPVDQNKILPVSEPDTNAPSGVTLGQCARPAACGGGPGRGARAALEAGRGRPGRAGSGSRQSSVYGRKSTPRTSSVPLVANSAPFPAGSRENLPESLHARLVYGLLYGVAEVRMIVTLAHVRYRLDTPAQLALFLYCVTHNLTPLLTTWSAING